ncbi:S8 family serine peptidase [Actinosynnema sp. NPDC047251]|uniref:Peptidase S8/S53, subtilisin kexin sedolisin n=1 Tax=Saccharothrix espanaensis (strain ATCC 51144 / DSM 44229 / JCM 9112 / NBRC 15066 / NRRL 15764) TaxID=1179773 RepID=K0K947_SACES|nr:S8 family serine peptidase [Saccharothrix espanaensis]CCH33118.1 Peptidase S8/S53, subtilisin kexin sedolisin [Saccharothrix espanaensis DSM 44229]
MTRRRTPLLVAGVVMAAVLTAVTGPGSALAERMQEQRPTTPGPDGVVTLVTGDRVELRGGKVSVRAGQGRADVLFHHFKDERGDLNVVPSDAAADLRSGRLDARLFDVTGLIRAGYDDRSSPATPLIVTSGGAQVTGGTRELPSVGGYALEAAKDTAFWSGARAAGVAKVWLDGPVRATLDRSVPQIGAPAAWQGGHTGRGATVAVLDTGVDATHPDLADAIVEAKNFSDSDSTDDRVGHGTHVAATITGSGRYQGVAPDSKLLVGKVLGDSGGGRESDIIAGMQWAAEARADVVNLSLGSPWPTDGSDPMSQALNRISADSDVLFVVAAGNSGPSERTIGSPAAADAALTVGAVDREDKLAGFSSRGPRRLDDAIKPDITAPGVGIAAAKAKNGTIGDPVDATHVALSGTSMATPHVAGAAAILAAQHPGWTAQQLKSALAGSAEPNPALSVHEQGAGRVDVARATRQAVQASPSSLSLGTASWPHADDAPIERKLAYRNEGTSPVALRVAAELKDPKGNPAPAGMAVVTPAEVTVAPGASAEVSVTVRTSVAGPDGIYSGVLVATGGDTVVRTPVGVTKEVESYDVQLTFRDRDGALTPAYFYRLVSVNEARAHLQHDPSGVVRARLPKDTYYFDAWVQGEDRQTTWFAEPKVVVAGPAALEFDARAGKRITTRVDEPEAAPGNASTLIAMKTEWGDTGSGVVGNTFDRQFYVPSRTSWPGRAAFTVQSVLARPDGDGRFVGSPYQYHVSSTDDGGIPADLAYRYADRDLARVESRVAASGPGQAGFLDQVAGGPLPLRVLHRYSPGVDWYGSFTQMANPTAFPPDTYQSDAAARRFRVGPATAVEWNKAVFGPAFPAVRRADDWAGRRGDQVRVSVPLFTDQDPGHYGYSQVTKARTTLHRDGVPVAESPDAGSLYAVVPAGKGSFRLHTEASRDGVAELSTQVSATWTFTSDTVAGDPAALPLSAVRFAPRLDEHNRAAAGRPFAFPVYVQRNGAAKPGDVRATVQVSYDDGASWKPVPLVKTGERWIAAVLHPAGAKFVSLRASAEDRAGNAVEQTIIRAYALK